MEEQDDASGSSWESPPNKSPPDSDSPWSWVRAAWPLRAAVPKEGACGARGTVCAERCRLGSAHS